MSSAKKLLSKEQLDKVKEAIVQAEKETTGEIRVHLENECPENSVEKAWEVFEALNMKNTTNRNAVLIYIAVEDHKVSIIGDENIHQSVDEHFWQNIIEQLISQFKENAFLEGICQAVHSVGLILKKHFPCKEEENTDELFNDVTFG